MAEKEVKILYLCGGIVEVDLLAKRISVESFPPFIGTLQKRHKVKEIKLTKGLVALVDDDDFYWLNQWQWYAMKGGNTFYAARARKRGTAKSRTVLMHRVVMRTPDGLEVDHIDHNGLNNQKSNLRNCTHKQNLRNVNTKNSTGFRGVKCRKDKRCIKEHTTYEAIIGVDGGSVYLGGYKTPQEAAIAYDIKAKELFGEFAKLNFPNI